MTPATAPHEQLRAAGLRVTAARLATLEILAANPHSTADFVASGVRDRLGGVSIQTVYDVLRVCAEHGLLRKIEPAGSPVRYETRVGDNHHHLVCRGCARIVDVDCEHGTSPCQHPDYDHGFVIDEAELTFWGVCNSCRTARTADQ